MRSRSRRTRRTEHRIIVQLDDAAVTVDRLAFFVAFALETDFAAAFVAVPEYE
jgi:hypothetical protein